MFGRMTHTKPDTTSCTVRYGNFLTQRKGNQTITEEEYLELEMQISDLMSTIAEYSQEDKEAAYQLMMRRVHEAGEGD